MGNIELYELGQVSRTVQCHSCWKHLPEGLAFCSCGICLRPDEAKMKRIKVRFQTIKVPYYLARIKRSRGKTHGETQWQQDHWKAMDAKRGTKQRDKDTITLRWQQDEKYRNSQRAYGWTEEYCRDLDYLTTIDISYTAPWHQRHRYESTITLTCNDEDREAGPMKATKDFRPTTKIIASVRQEQ